MWSWRFNRFIIVTIIIPMVRRHQTVHRLTPNWKFKTNRSVFQTESSLQSNSMAVIGSSDTIEKQMNAHSFINCSIQLLEINCRRCGDVTVQCVVHAFIQLIRIIAVRWSSNWVDSMATSIVISNDLMRQFWQSCDALSIYNWSLSYQIWAAMIMIIRLRLLMWDEQIYKEEP